MSYALGMDDTNMARSPSPDAVTFNSNGHKELPDLTLEALVFKAVDKGARSRTCIMLPGVSY